MSNILTQIYQTLFDHYGDLRWWPAKTPYEVIVGAILTQNTSWTNVEKAISNFGDNLAPENIAGMDIEDLVQYIRPAGYYNQKAVYLKTVTAWFAKYGYDELIVKDQPMNRLRSELLLTKGVGQETADSILLYAFGFLTFVIDAYTHRLCERYTISAGKNYAEVKAYFEGNLPRDENIYKNYHALIVINGKDYCKKKPLCVDCSLSSTCAKKNAQDPTSG
jgi:endonuclease-3 related protein